MTSAVITPYQPSVRAGSDGFGHLLRAEWTKFRSIRGWIIGMVGAMLVMLALGLIGGSANFSCASSGGGPAGSGGSCQPPPPPTGPGGEPVTDSFYVVRQPMTGDGSMTVRVTSFTGRYTNGVVPAGQGLGTPGLQPWSKAGIIIKASTRQGSAYAAMLLTGSHGVRMQYDYTGDIAGPAAMASPSSPVWLRLTRSGGAITGYESANGSTWTKVGAVTLPALPSTVQAGVFTTSPQHSVINLSFGGGEQGRGGPSLATASFDHLSLRGGQPGQQWTGTQIGADQALLPGGYRHSGNVFAVTGSGDIAPSLGDRVGGQLRAGTIEQHLVGAFAALIVVIVIGAMFITVEYRRGLIRLTLAASPRRGRVLAAKAVVIGLVSFVAGLIAAAIAVPLGTRLSTDGGFYVFPVSMATEIRVIAGTALLIAVTAILAMAVGTILRRSAAAIALVIVVIVLPYILAVASVLPLGAANWLLRLTPAAGFAIQQSVPAYPQVTALYAPGSGYYPLAPWAGFAVLCGYTVIALAIAAVVLRRRDA